MRVLSLMAVVWSFVGMPTLCRAGILDECCALGVPERAKSHDVPGDCPDQCPEEDEEKCPESTAPSEPRDCDSCAEGCNVVSPHSKQTSDDDVAAVLTTAIAVTQPFGDPSPRHRNRLRDGTTERLHQHLPFPASDRPLLI